MEIEAKYRIDDPAVFAELAELRGIGAFVLEPGAQVEHQANTYYDSADGRLRARKYGMRVRAIAGRRIATVKGEGEVSGALHRRGEWEVDIGASDHPSDWPPSEARERALALLDGAEPVAILQVTTARRRLYARRVDAAAPSVELSLDEGVIVAGSRRQHFRELEAELLRGAPESDLHELLDALRARYALTSEERTKLARGLALLLESTA